MPLEIELARSIERYGADAIGLAPLNVLLSRRIALCDSVQHAFKSRAGFSVMNEDGQVVNDWAEWAKHYPEQNDLLIWIERQANG